MTAVITAVASIILIYLLGKQLLGKVGAVATSVFLATTPIFMIQSHLALDNIAPVPFVVAWLFWLYIFGKTKKNYWLILSAVSLGISFYSYKSMRIFVPVWTILSLIYLINENIKSWLKPVLIFSFSILPFFVAVPFLEFLYAGAVLNKANPEINNIYSFVSFYLSNFDPSFLFVKGDDLLFHSTGRHGMYILMSLPFFVLGLASSWKKSNFWKLIIVSFFLGPLMFGYIGQIHRASRLMALIPLYSLISGSGFLYLWQKRSKILIGILTIFFIVNYFDFIHYYLIDYAKDTKTIFYNFESIDRSFKILKEESVERNLTPYVDQVIMTGLNPTRDFARVIYFAGPLNTWNGVEKEYPAGAILMTDNGNINFLKQIDHFDRYYFYVKQ
jgi:4-amino-4-deoxy-L-arabinose transferase-like glycosyltransferase